MGAPRQRWWLPQLPGYAAAATFSDNKIDMQSEIHNPRGWKSRLFQPLFFSQVLGDWLCITLPYCVFRALLSLVS